MRVLLIGSFTSHVSVHNVCEELATFLEDGGWPVVTASRRTSRAAKLWDMLQTTWTYRHQFDVAQIDVFSGPAFFWAEAVCWLLRRLHKPYLLALRGGNLPTFAARWPGRVRRLLHSAAGVTAPSFYLIEALKPYGSHIELLPNPIKIEAYTFHPRKEVAPNLVWLRAFHEVYNPLLAVRTAALLREEFPNIRLMMVGPDKHDGSWEQTQALARELGLLDTVVFTGGVPKADVPRYLNSGDILLNTPRIDNTPASVLEAMACGLCIVSTKVGGMSYLVQDGHDGLLVPSDDPHAMAAAVRRILTDNGLAGRLSQQARLKAESVSWSEVLPQWKKMFEAAHKSAS